jgi:hypothetical protein
MEFDSFAQPKVFRLYTEISEYPILASSIREQMRRELFRRGVISPTDFEKEVKEKAIRSQVREGLTDPLVQEPQEQWQTRLARIRDNLTDFYFAHNLPHEYFENIVRAVLARRVPAGEVVITFNAELATWEMLFAQGEKYESLSPEQQARVAHHLREIRVVLIKGMISDQLGFVGIARDVLTVADLNWVRARRIGRGKIGGKAAGMLLAWKILESAAASEGLELKAHVMVPESYFIGADVFYDFATLNNLHSVLDQKYKTQEQIEEDYPHIQEAFLRGHFADDTVAALRHVLETVGDHPLIVRSSSLLEDNFGTSFAGKYESVYLPNQGSVDENLAALLQAVARVYASVFSPDALFYRQQMGLLDYDERMAILLQEVQGDRHGDYFFPTLAGVGFSHNPFRWTPKIRREDGFLRLVWGLGTRAVERVDNDYPRMVALSHPLLRPEVGAQQLKHYAQHFIDVLNLAENEFQTLPVGSLLSMRDPAARLLVSVDRGDYLQPPMAYDPGVAPHDLVLTFETLLGKTRFPALMQAILQTLSAHFRRPVDLEFTADVVREPGKVQPEFCIHLLQCRPQARQQLGQAIEVPAAVPEADTLFTADRLVPHGIVPRVRTIVFVDPEAYYELPNETARFQIARLIGRLNEVLEPKRFILMGPGRWGSTNAALGVKVGYADLYNAAALIEIGLSDAGGTPEVSYGTHFFQDLVEAGIYPLALFPGQGEAIFSWRFFRESPNDLPWMLPAYGEYARCVRVIDVPAAAGGRLLEIIMDGERGKAIGYLRQYE